jgi:protein SCO1/2
MRALRLALWTMVALALFAFGAVSAYLLLGEPRSQQADAYAGAPLGGPFSLVDQNGEPVTEKIFRGRPTVTLFGFTHCPDVCPTGLMEMARFAEALGPDADKLGLVFVTVDPERDTPSVLKDYVTAFSDRIVAVTGEPEKVAAMLADYKIYSRKVPAEGGDYTMDHTASMMLQDADGNFVGTISPGEPRDTALEKVRRLVAG